MRRQLFIVMAVAITLAIVPVAYAGAYGDCACVANCSRSTLGATGVSYSLTGVATAVDATDGTMDVRVRTTNRRAVRYRGTEVTLTITPTTKLLRRTADGQLVPIALSDFTAGDRVSSVGTLDRSDPANPLFTAYRVTLRPPLGSCGGCGR